MPAGMTAIELEALRRISSVLDEVRDEETRLRVLAVAAIELRQYAVAAALLGELVRLGR